MTIVIIFILICVGIIVVLFLKLFSSKNSKLKEAIRLEANGKYYDALSIYDYLLNNGYLVEEIRWKIANLSMKINNYARALKELSILLHTGILPQNITFYAVNKLMAECYLKQNMEKEAFFCLLELLQMNQDDPWVLFEIGKIYAGQGLTGRAIKFFERALRSSPNDPEINYFLAKAYLDFGDSEKALEYLEKTARLKYFDNGRVNYYLGILYFSQKNYNLALQHFPLVIKLRPNDNVMLSNAHHFIALCYKEKGLIDEALVNFEKSQMYSEVLQEKSLNKKALYNEGILLLKQGKYEKALEKLYKVKMLDYTYKDVDHLIKIINAHRKSGERIPDTLIDFINENPLSFILKKGLLYSKTRFNITLIEKKAEKYINALTGKNTNNINNSTQLEEKENKSSYNIISISNFNTMSSKQFKDLSRKIVRAIGFNIKSEPKFIGDSEYIDGNAINFLCFSIKDQKNKNSYLITIRRYKEPVSELSVSRFIEWFEEGKYNNGIFIASSTYSPQAFKIMKTNPNVKFIDRSGLAKILGRIS